MGVKKQLKVDKQGGGITINRGKGTDRILSMKERIFAINFIFMVNMVNSPAAEEKNKLLN